MDGFLPDNILLPIPLRILSSTPGRVRVRVDRDYREPEILTEFAGALQSFVTEIDRIKANSTTGSLTIYYDAGHGDLANTFVMLQELGIIVNETETIPVPADSEERLLPHRTTTTLAANITGALTGWNQRVYQFTEGAVDLKSLVPFLLGSWAIRQFVKGNARMKFVPWYALAWYAFDAFMKLNKSPEVAPPSTNNNSHHLLTPVVSVSKASPPDNRGVPLDSNEN